MSKRTPLARPSLPDDFAPVVRTSPTLGIFGTDAMVFACALRDALRALDKEPLLLQAELRHAAGFYVDGERLVTHPDALREALGSLDERPLLGVGEVFARGVVTDFAIAIGFEANRRARVDLALREVRLGLAAPLARTLIARGSGARW